MFSSDKKEKNSEESMTDKLGQEIKSSLHMLVHELLENQVSNTLMFNLFTFIETLQLNYFLIHPLTDTYTWDSNILTTYRQIIQYFQINSILQGSVLSTRMTFMYLFFAFTTIFVFLIVLVITRISSTNRKASAMLGYMVKLLAFLGLLTITILPLPFFNSYLTTMVCTADSPYSQGASCYSGIYFLHLAVAVIGFFMLVVLSLIFHSIFIDLNPTSTIPFAAPQSMLRLLKLGIKLILPFYVTIDPNGQFIQQFIVVHNLLFLSVLFFRFQAPPIYNSDVQRFTLYCETSLFWISFCVMITTFLDSDSESPIGLLYFILCLPMLWLSLESILNKKEAMSKSMAVKDFKSDEDVEGYVLMLLKHIENREDPNSRIQLEGILRYHTKSCEKAECHCHTLIKEVQNDEELEVSRTWYLFVRSVLEEALEEYEKSTRLHLLFSFILHEKLNNNFKALFELMISQTQKCSLEEEFSIYRFARQIEGEIKENDEKTSDTRNVDVNKIVLFQNKFVEFQGSIQKSVQLHLDFWLELLEENPEIQKIENTGSKITSSVLLVREQFVRLREIYGNHIRCLEIFGYFLKEVVNDMEECGRILENMKYARNSQNVNKQFVDSDRLKYGENSNTAILTVSGNHAQVGTLTNLNNELTRILGWTKVDVLDQNISKIMPKIYADIHDKLMENYLQTSVSKVIGTERVIICVNKSQYIVPCTLMIKVLPNLDEGISIAGFLKEIDVNTTTEAHNIRQQIQKDLTPQEQAVANESDDHEHYMVFSNENDIFVMQGITQSCFNSFGIPASLMHGNNSNNSEFTLDLFCPEIANLESFDELRSPAGIVVGFDTTQISKNFLIDEGNSDDENSDDGGGAENENTNTNMNTNFNNEENDDVNGSGGGGGGGSDNDGENSLNDSNENLNGKDRKNNHNNNNEKFGNEDHGNNNNHQNQQNNNDDSDEEDLSEGEIRRRRQSKYKSTRVRMHLVLEQTLDDRKIYVVKFSEVDEFDEGKPKAATTSDGGYPDQYGNEKSSKRHQQSNQLHQDQDEQDYDAADGNDDDGENNNGEDYNASDHDSNVSNQSMNDEFRKLKDFKSLISEKTVPLSIGILKKTVLVLIVILLTLSSVELSLKLTQDTVIQEGSTSIFTAFRRPSIIADVCFYARRASNLANSIRLPSTGQTQAAALASDQNTSNQFTNMNNLIRMDSTVYNLLSAINYDVKFQQQTRNDIKTYSNLLTDAMIQLITSSSSLANSTMTSFVDNPSSSYVDSTLKNIYYVLTNGLFVLRNGTEYEAKQIFSFYYGKLSDYEQNIRIILIVAIIVLVLSLAILIPYVFKVHKTNHQVLSLFGIINLEEIKLLVGRCEAYNTKYIEDKKFNGETNQKENDADDNQIVDLQEKDGKGEDSKLEIDGEGDNEGENMDGQAGGGQKNGKGGGKGAVNMKTEVELAEQHGGGKGGAAAAAAAGAISKKKTKKHGKKGENDDGERGQKLKNSRDNNRKRVVLQFSIFSLLFTGYFIIGFVMQLNFMQNMRNIFNHLSQVSQRSTVIKYCLAYLAEEVTTDTKQLENSVNNLWRFIDLSYQLENQITMSSLDTYPSNLSTYFSTFTQANFGDFCTLFPENATLTQAKCALVNSAMLKKGLKISIISFVEDIRKMITAYESSGNTALTAKQTLFASDAYVELEEMEFYITPMIEQMNSVLLSSIDSYVSSFGSTEVVKFCIFLGGILFVFIVIWLPYLSYLSEKIWSTKGMLNMIPMSIISKDPKLKQAFASGDILQAVQ